MTDIGELSSWCLKRGYSYAIRYSHDTGKFIVSVDFLDGSTFNAAGIKLQDCVYSILSKLED